MAGKKIVFKILGVAAGLVFVGSGINDYREISRIKKAGEVAVVGPIANYTEFRRSGSKTFTAEFKFKTAAGAQIVKKTSFPEELLADFKAGTPVKVVYNPADPYDFVFEKQTGSWTLIAGGVGMAAAALLLL